jgi:O-antigen/teichoic acid export membrane protein
MINLRGELFATAVSFGAISILKLLSSVILTRLLYPEAYGIVTMVASVAFVMEMLSDVGVVGLMVRHERGEEQTFINAMWTIRLLRGVINAVILFLIAPLLARLYGAPALEGALRIFSGWFVIYGLESMSFALAVRRQNSRLVNYTELAATVGSTVFVIIVSYFWRDHRGMVWGMLVNRALITAASFLFYRDKRPRVQFDRGVTRVSMAFARYTVPSSLVTLFVSQFDKFVFLKLFPMQLLGLYGLAGNIAGPIDALISKITRSVLYPRCAANFRREPATVRDKYYSENVKLVLFILFMPAALAGAAQLIVHVLFDHRYAYAWVILQAFALRGMLGAMASLSENVLVATDTPRPLLIGNLLRAAWLVPGSLLGWHFAGFTGFLYMAALETLPALLFFLWLQHRRGLMIPKYEALKLAFMGVVFLASLAVCSQLIAIVPPIRSRAGI